MDILLNLLEIQINSTLFERLSREGSSDECISDAERVFAGVKNGETWSHKMIDASTKIPTGILTGNKFDLGNYDECLGVSTPLQGKHCLADIKLPPDLIGNWTPHLVWSYCLPKSCTAKDLEMTLSGTISLIGGNVSVQDKDCHDSLRRPLNPLDYFAIFLFAIVTVICILSTIYDVWKTRRSEKKSELYSAFSFYCNSIQLFGVESAADTLAPLHGLRFLSIVWIILGHRYFYMRLSPNINVLQLLEDGMSWSHQPLDAYVLAVDTFFVLSGLLNTYNLVKLLDKTKKFNFSQYYVHRFIRLTPPLAVTVLLYLSLGQVLGDGPVWHLLIDNMMTRCERNWWKTLLYINNYYDPAERCVMQSWYLSVDMQLYWLAPLVILPCWRWPKLAKYYLGSLALLSAIPPFVTVYAYELKMQFLTPLPEVEERIRQDVYSYCPTHTRATPYIIGIILGLYIHHLRKSGRKFNLSKRKVIIGWIFALACLIGTIWSNYPFAQIDPSHRENRLESSFFTAFLRVGWGSAIAWIILACLHGYGGVVNSILSWECFIPFSRLTYSIYMTHFAVFSYQLATVRTSAYYREFDFVHRFFGDLLLTTVLAILLSLMIEMPSIAIEKHLRGTKRLPGNSDRNDRAKEGDIGLNPRV